MNYNLIKSKQTIKIICWDIFFTIIFREQLVIKCNIIHEQKDLSSAYYINYNKAISL